MSEKQSENSEMSELVFASRMMQTRIAPPGSAGSKGERLRNAALTLRWKHSRARGVWYAEPGVSIKPRELRQIEELTGVEYAQKELRTNDELIAHASALLVGHEADFYSAFVAALRSLARPHHRT
ncbi:hypothetical protein FJV76_14375 [Mesorhizobium sp. WSM4303]|nr:hypothetical protein FJV76_14375 [Mesorhizobium sp. WSM4303]